MDDLATLENGIALADRLDWLLSILALRLRQAMQRDQELAGGGLRLALLLAPGLTAIEGLRHDLRRLGANYLDIHDAIRDRKFGVMDDE